MYSKWSLSLVVFMVVCSLWGCESKDYCAYSSCEFEEMSAPDADMRGDVECVSGDECPSLANAQASCSAAGECVYTCDERWAVGPGGDLKREGCTCDKTMSSCQSDAVCGDGFKEGEEQCDQGQNNSDTEPDACRSSCKQAACGDKVVDAGEVCDDGDDDNSDDCTQGCSRCGNGKIDEGETCDDGQYPPVSGDGCSATCQTEPYWYCEPGTGCELYLNSKRYSDDMTQWGFLFTWCDGKLIVSAQNSFDMPQHVGGLDVLEYDGLEWMSRFVSSPFVVANNYYGLSLACVGDRLVVGSQGVNTSNLNGDFSILKEDFSVESNFPGPAEASNAGFASGLVGVGDFIISSAWLNFQYLKIYKRGGVEWKEWASYLGEMVKYPQNNQPILMPRVSKLVSNGKDVAAIVECFVLLKGALILSGKVPLYVNCDVGWLREVWIDDDFVYLAREGYCDGNNKGTGCVDVLDLIDLSFVARLENFNDGETLVLDSISAGSNGGARIRRMVGNGEYLAVSDLKYNNGEGRVVVFKKGPNGWVDAERRAYQPMLKGGSFGAHLVIDGGTLWVGAPKLKLNHLGAGGPYYGAVIPVDLAKLFETPAR